MSAGAPIVYAHPMWLASMVLHTAFLLPSRTTSYRLMKYRQRGFDMFFPPCLPATEFFLYGERNYGTPFVVQSADLQSWQQAFPHACFTILVSHASSMPLTDYGKVCDWSRVDAFHIYSALQHALDQGDGNELLSSYIPSSPQQWSTAAVPMDDPAPASDSDSESDQSVV